jgi:hypothetical protein
MPFPFNLSRFPVIYKTCGSQIVRGWVMMP